MLRTGILAAALGLGVVLAASADDKVKPISKEAAQKIKKLQVQRRDLLKKGIDLQFRAIKSGGALRLDVLTRLSKELLQAELDLAATPKERVAAHAARLEIATKIEKDVKAAYDAGGATTLDLTLAQADRLEAEIGWRKAGGEDKKDK